MSDRRLDKILITVMTYPHPSAVHQELVCTAGVTEGGEWIRLYPIDYRYQPRDRQFHKYQWIEVETHKPERGKDNRKESRRPDLDTLRIVSEPLDTRNHWKQRREIIDRIPHLTRHQLEASFEVDKTSLGIVRPSRIIDLEIREADPEWKPAWQKELAQLRLFGPQPKPLTKLPFSFHYIFECEDSKKPHTAMCEDWELGVLFLKLREQHGSDVVAANLTRERFLTELCGPTKDTRFFMGTFFPYNKWLVLGVFWPPKDRARSLFL